MDSKLHWNYRQRPALISLALSTFAIAFIQVCQANEGATVASNSSLATSGGISLAVESPNQAQRLLTSPPTASDCLKMYKQAWSLTGSNFFKPVREWKSWSSIEPAKIETEEEAIARAKRMLGSLHDHYTRVFTPTETDNVAEAQRANYQGIGVIIKMQRRKDGSPVRNHAKPPEVEAALAPTDGIMLERIMEGGPAEQAGITKNDALVAVDDHAVRGETTAQIVKRLRGPAGSEVTVTLLRDGATRKITLKRAVVPEPVIVQKLIEGDIAYIRLFSFQPLSAARDIRLALFNQPKAKAIILDLRGNSGGSLGAACSISSMFLKEGKIMSLLKRDGGTAEHPTFYTESIRVTKDSIISESTKGGSKSTNTQKRWEYLANDRPVVVLVDRYTASAAECTAAALRENNAGVILGTRTFGKGILQQYIEMPLHTMLSVTGGKILTPAGNWVGNGQDVRRGIRPDVKLHYPKDLKTLVKLDPFAVDLTTDKPLAAAVSYIRKSLDEPVN